MEFKILDFRFKIGDREGAADPILVVNLKSEI
jgi:hypothetical protein